MYPCPCCGFLVFNTSTGSYELCPICDWEDDNVQLRYPGMEGGANGESLWDAQQRILAKIPVNIQKIDCYARDNRWRPLDEGEVADMKSTAHEVRNTADGPLTGEYETGWVLVEEDPLNTLDYYWLRHN